MRFIRDLQYKLTIADHKELLRCILKLLERDINARVLDLGCNDGSKTLNFARAIGIENCPSMYGVDIIDKQILAAKARGISVVKCDCEMDLPFESETFDSVISNQLIEHVNNTDRFVENIYRILKKKAYTIIATENISYLANIVAIALGYQAFSQNISNRFHLGNPFSASAGQMFNDSFSTHKRIFSVRGLPAFLRRYGFRIEAVLGAGFAPLPSLFSRIDKIHSRFITIKARKF